MKVRRLTLEAHAQDERLVREHRGIFFNMVAMIHKLSYVGEQKRLAFEMLYTKTITLAVGRAG